MFADQKDKLFCEIGVDLGFITQEQVEKALEKQKIDQSVGVNSPIGGYLFKENIITREQIRQILKMQGKLENAVTSAPAIHESAQQMNEGNPAAAVKQKDGADSGYVWPILITIAIIGFFFIGLVFLGVMIGDSDKDLLLKYNNDYYKTAYNTLIELGQKFKSLHGDNTSDADVLQFLKYQALPEISEKLTEANNLTPPEVCKNIHKDFAGNIKKLKIVVDDLIRCVEAQNSVAYLTSAQEFFKILTDCVTNYGELKKISEKHDLAEKD